MAYPLHCFWRQHLCGGFHSETSQDVALAAKPAIEGCVTHSGSFCQLVFVCAFHTTNLRNFSDFCKKIFANLFTSFQKFSTAFEKVVPLQCSRDKEVSLQRRTGHFSLQWTSFKDCPARTGCASANLKASSHLHSACTVLAPIIQMTHVTIANVTLVKCKRQTWRFPSRNTIYEWGHVAAHPYPKKKFWLIDYLSAKVRRTLIQGRTAIV